MWPVIARLRGRSLPNRDHSLSTER